jgi:dipeptidase E
MRLLLSSFFLTPERAAAVLPAAPPGGGRAGIVLNALDGAGTARRVRDYDRECRSLAAAGYRGEELDLREYFGTPPDSLAERLSGLDLVWVLGGNAFVLARAMTAAGFAAALRAQADRPDFGYGGYSAGACVTGPDLRGIELIDDPDVRPDGYPADAEPHCLGLQPDRIVPHWRSEHPETGGAERAAAHLTGLGLAHRCLRDGDVLAR